MNLILLVCFSTGALVATVDAKPTSAVQCSEGEFWDEKDDTKRCINCTTCSGNRPHELQPCSATEDAVCSACEAGLVYDATGPLCIRCERCCGGKPHELCMAAGFDESMSCVNSTKCGLSGWHYALVVAAGIVLVSVSTIGLIYYCNRLFGAHKHTRPSLPALPASSELEDCEAASCDGAQNRNLTENEDYCSDIAFRPEPEGSQTDQDDSGVYSVCHSTLRPDLEGNQTFRKETLFGEEVDELSDENGSNCSESRTVSFPDYNLEKYPPLIYTKDNSGDIFPKFFPKKTKARSARVNGRKEISYSLLNTTNISDQEVEDCSTCKVDQMQLKCDVISDQMDDRWSTKLERDPNKLLLYDQSQHFPRIEEVRVVQAPPAETNDSHNAPENEENNTECLENIPSEEEEELYEVDYSITPDERHDSRDAAQGSESGDNWIGCARNTDDVAAIGAEDKGSVEDEYQQIGEAVAAQDTHEIGNNNDAAQHSPGGRARQSMDIGVANDSGYGSTGSIDAYQRVTFSFLRASVMLLGYRGAGKTCLGDTLLELPFKDPKNTRESQSEQLDDLSNSKVAGIHVHASGQKWTQLDESLGEALTKDLETRLTDVIATENWRREERKLTTRLKILDMDGEFPFYQVHPTLMSTSMIFLLVMDVTKKLDDDLPESASVRKWKEKIECPNTPRKFLDHWLASISTFLNQHDDPSQYGTTKSIVLVLTHTDKLDPKTRRDEIKAFEKEVRSHVRKQHAAKYVVKTIISVSNTDRDICRDELRNLKDTVLRIAQSKPTFSVPAVWFKFEADVVKHCEAHNKKYLNVREMLQLSGPIGMSREQFKEFLAFHKQLGSLYYIDDESEDSLVVTDPQFLLDAFTTIIDMWIHRRTSQWSLTDQEALDTDLDDGIFSQQNLSLIWGKHDDTWDETVFESLTFILKSSLMFIPSVQKDEEGNILSEKYIMPSLQPPLVEPDTDVQDTTAPKTLVYFFHTAQEQRMILNSGFLPRGFLFLLITSLMEEKENRGRWEKIQLFCNGATFRAGTHGDIDITMWTDTSMIKLNVLTSKHQQSNNICAEISTARSTFEYEVKQLLQNRFKSLLCSVCVSPCHTGKEICQLNYSCLNILGSLGQVGTKLLWSARCKTHGKEAEMVTFKDWFHNELNQLSNENSAANSDERFINHVSDNIPNVGTQKNIAIRLDITGCDVDRSISNCPNDIKAASLRGLINGWYEKTKGNLQRGSQKYEQLKRAFNEAGVHHKALQ